MKIKWCYLIVSFAPLKSPKTKVFFFILNDRISFKESNSVVKIFIEKWLQGVF